MQTMEPTPANKTVVLNVNISNLGSQTARDCEIFWWPIGYGVAADKVIPWFQHFDIVPGDDGFVHFAHSYEETGTFTTALIIKCDNYVSNEIFHTITIT